MSEQANLDELARRYLDLWQDQMAALTADKDFAEALQQLMSAAGLATPATHGDPKADAPTEDVTEPQAAEPGVKPESAPAVGAAPAAASSDRGHLVLAELARRLGAVEERIAALESGIARGRGGARKKPRQRRS